MHILQMSLLQFSYFVNQCLSLQFHIANFVVMYIAVNRHCLLLQVDVENEKPSVRIVNDETTGQKLADITYDHPDYASYAAEVFNGKYFASVFAFSVIFASVICWKKCMYYHILLLTTVSHIW